MVISETYHFPFEEVDTLEETDRGKSGFGGSGVK